MFIFVSEFWKMLFITVIALAVGAHFCSVPRPPWAWDWAFYLCDSLQASKQDWSWTNVLVFQNVKEDSGN